ncbi:MAG: tripartite tricarboxylate transporter substrate binding protein [Alphaproteobacteria bacterium]|nr:MAG: tripartite tricarboxylate transporter substrate binding protein [Alphaproteobacteria bacterium]
MTLSRRHVLSLAVTALPVFVRGAAAQGYPERPVRVVVGFPAGGSVDIFARLVAQSLSEQFGQPFVIENRPGASGNTATEALARSVPDGYMLLAVGVNNATNAALYDNLKFDFLRDIVPIASTVRGVGVLVVNPAVPAASTAEFIAYARANPGKINMASSGTGTPQHLYGELFMQMTGVRMVHVPYRGSPQSLTGLLGGEVQAMFDTLSTSIEHIKAGRLRALGVTSATRVENLPDVPALGEAVPGYEATSWQGFGAPNGTPGEIVEKLNRAIGLALADATVKTRIEALGYSPFATSPAQFRQHIADETAKWGKVIRAANIHLN